MRFIRQPNDPVRLGDLLRAELGDPARGWLEFRAAIAFVKRSGVQHVAEELADFGARGSIRMSVGIDLWGTSKEGLEALLDVVSTRGGEVWIFHNDDRVRPTFHPKIYLFKKADKALVIIGSGNLTSGGLFTNYEANFAVELDLRNGRDSQLLDEVESTLDEWVDPTQNLARILDVDLVRELEARGLIQPESRARGDQAPEGEPESRTPMPDLFGRVRVPFPPPRPRTSRAAAGGARRQNQAPQGGRRGFLMTLQRTDVGTGQTTPGTSRRSPEVFIPLKALREDEAFWGFPGEFVEDSGRAGKFDRLGVRMRIGTQEVAVNMMTWPVKHDFRLRAEPLRSAGQVGDILRIERALAGSGFDYYVEVVPQGTTEHGRRLAQCVRDVPNSHKRYGYY